MPSQTHAGLANAQSLALTGEYYVQAADTNTYAVGDPVKVVAGSSSGQLPDGRTITGIPAVERAGAGEPYIGAVVGILRNVYETELMSLPAAKQRGYVVVISHHPHTLFELQSNSRTALAASAVGQLANFAVASAAGSVSGYGLDAATIGVGHQVRILRILEQGPYTRVLCANALHQYDALAGRPQRLGTSHVDSAVTGTTSETVLWSLVLPAGTVGLNDTLTTHPALTVSSSGNSKTLRVRLGPTSTAVASRSVLWSVVSTTTITSFPFVGLRMRNSLTAGLLEHATATTTGAARGYGQSSNPLLTTTVDNSVEQTLTVSAELANGADTATLSSVVANLERA